VFDNFLIQECYRIFLTDFLLHASRFTGGYLQHGAGGGMVFILCVPMQPFLLLVHTKTWEG
jgi:hypothetical protein